MTTTYDETVPPTRSTDVDVVTPDVVTTAEQAQVLATAAQSAHAAGQALERATQAVIDNPGIAGREEFLSLAAQARMLHLSGAAPEAVREDPYIAFHVAMAGRDLGLSPSAALNLIDVIHTSKGPQLSLSPQLRLAQVRRQGLGDIRPQYRGVEQCIADVLGPDGQKIGESEFTWEDARLAGLVGPQCMPGAHHTQTKQGRNGGTYERCPCNQGYITYPKRMLWWRAVGYGCDDYFPEASVGLYSPEELGATTDEDGNLIDPSTAALPPGYTDPKAEQKARQAERDAPADAADRWDLQERIHALPDGIAADLRAQWVNPQSRIRGVPAWRMPQRLMKTARSMVNAHWAKAAAAGVDMDAELADTRSRAAAIVAGLLAAVFFAPPQPPSGPETPADGPPAPTAPGDTPQDSTGRTAAESAAADVSEAAANAANDRRDAIEATATDEPAETPDEKRERKRAERALAVMWADEVKATADGVPPAIADRIVADVQGLHHAKVNAELADAGLADDVPPSAHIDVRRMALVTVRLQAFKDSGVTPGADT